CEVELTEWTEDGRLRHPSFQGLREDKDPAEVTRERPKAAPRPARKPGGAAEVAGVPLTSPDRVLYEGMGLTKLDLARYYERVAEPMLPHVADRPLSLVRCPQGRGGECFFQKHVGDTFPEAVGRVEIREKEGEESKLYGTVSTAAGLVALVQMGVLEIHVWGSRTDRLERPDRVVFDLDPDEGLAWERVIEATFALRARLAELGLESFVKTTGGKGLHVVVPLTRRHGWDEVKDFARAVAADMVRREPGKYTDNVRKASRKGRIFIDYLRNARGATFIAPFSTRAREGAPVSVPIAWREVAPDLRSDRWSAATLPGRLSRLKKDPWGGIGQVRQSITQEIRQKLGL
ncbi:MAG TPA: DNA ligase D, partial [Thermoanaerobaculia bacterium]|nr:DNA ligase D [Thermoanaerobaculia bacterium]